MMKGYRYLLFAYIIFDCQNSEANPDSYSPESKSGNIELIEMAKLDAANGFIQGGFTKYKQFLDPRKKFWAFHSHGEYTSMQTIWIILIKNNILACIYNQNVEDAPTWVGIKTKNDEENSEKISKLLQEFDDLIKKYQNDRHHINTDENDSSVYDIYTSSNNATDMAKASIPINQGDNSGKDLQLINQKHKELTNLLNVIAIRQD